MRIPFIERLARTEKKAASQNIAGLRNNVCHAMEYCEVSTAAN